MKTLFLSVGAALGFCSCAEVHVAHTEVARGAVDPSAIYIRPFHTVTAENTGGRFHGPGERPIRQSLAGREFAGNLKDQLEKLAPARILESDEIAPTGWVVDGFLKVIETEPRPNRCVVQIPPTTLGAARTLIHVRVRDAGRPAGGGSRVLYEFDLDGSSRSAGCIGSQTAPGLSEAAPFDFKNAAECVLVALSVDPFRYGFRDSPGIR